MFIHLHCHSHYSFLRAVPSPEEIIAAAEAQARSEGASLPASLRGGAVALTDTNGLYAAVPFVQKARAAGVKPIVGTVLDVSLECESSPAPSAIAGPPCRGEACLASEATQHAASQEGGSQLPHSAGRVPQTSSRNSGSEFHRRSDEILRPPETWRTQDDSAEHEKLDAALTWSGPRLVLLAQNREGYSNLCRLVTQRHLGGAPVSLEALDKHRAGLIALYASGQRSAIGDQRKSTIYRAPTTRTEYVAHLKEIFGDALYLEAHHFGSGGARRGAASGAPTGNLREAVQLSRALSVPLVATNNVHFLAPEEHLHHRVLNAIRTGTLLTKVAPPEIAHGEAYFKSAAEMQRAFADFPEALTATLEIAERCNLDLELGKTIFPECTVPEGETPFSYLWRLCFDGARQRYRPLRPEVLARLTHELEVINKLHLAPYFLLVWEIVEEARRRNIPAVARGSAASSMVTYCLGISRVCPLRWGLYFERFLNEERGDVPDIDIDICGARRDELLDWVYQRWGAEHVAMIGSFVTMHARMAVREVAKTFGLSPGEVNQFTRRLPHRPVRDIMKALATLPECRALPAQEEPWKTILDVALRLDGFPRHLGIHPCGTVISARPLTDLLPLERATKGIVVTQPDMNAVEALGLIKMDLLGQRGLTTMTLALENIRGTGTPACDTLIPSGNAAEFPAEDTDKSVCATKIDFEAIPENDPATCAMLAAGRTMGVFQIESPGLRGLLRAQKAQTMEDLCLAIAIIRPGAAEYGSKEAFLKRLRGAEPVRYPHPRLEPILRDTLGVCVYQEQVMQIALAAGGLSLAEADLVRRSQAKWADARERERFHAKFLKNAERLGLAGAQREAAWQMVEKFAGFGFCKAHAATYADLAYRMAYLKAHWPAEFLAAMCSANAGFYHVSAYVEEAKRWGIEVRLPSVNRSQLEYTAELVTAPVGRGFNPAEKMAHSFFPFARASALAEGGDSSAGPQGLKPGNNDRGFAAGLKPRPTNNDSTKGALRIGLMQVKGLRLETIRAILRSREERGAFRSLEDFLARVPVERDEIESLIKCGALDEVGQAVQPVHAKYGEEIGQARQPVSRPSRPALLWQLNLLLSNGAHAPSTGNDTKLFSELAGPATQMEIPALPDYTREQRLAYEQAILEVCVSGHPLDLVARNGEAWSEDVERRIGQRVTLLGWLITFRHVGTKDLRNMMFATLEDQRGLFEVVLFPEAYARFGRWVYEARILRVTGRVEVDGHVNCEKLEPVRQ
jgi:DNA-directed DNA polymerase III PolC